MTPTREPTGSRLIGLMALTQAASTQQVFVVSGLCLKFQVCKEHTVQRGRPMLTAPTFQRHTGNTQGGEKQPGLGEGLNSLREERVCGCGG